MDFLPSAFRLGGRERVKSLEDGMTESTYQPPTDSQATAVAAEDKLSIFRQLVGIHSTQSFAPSNPKTGALPDLSHNNLHFNGRAAPNLGIYNRVVHREQQAKRGYKFASMLINSCLGIQIIVAASLTALGAANSSHRAVTCFGAVNTVIAGLLTYLKGSGLPNRIRYYENEWKRVREYIEQRERDFSRPDCPLDVYEAARVIEGMYEEVKADIQTNTPDNYVSVGDIRARAVASMRPIPQLGSLNGAMSAQEKKIKELETKYGHKIADFLEGLAHKEEERLRRIQREVEEKGADVARRGEEIGSDVRARGSRAVDLGKDIEKEAAERRENVTRLGRELQDELTIHRRS